MSRPITWFRTVCAALGVLFALAASADEAAVRRMIEGKSGGAGGIESIRKAPRGDLYEVVLRGPDGPVVYYADDAASVIIVGQAIDATSGRNLTRYQGAFALKDVRQLLDKASPPAR